MNNYLIISVLIITIVVVIIIIGFRCSCRQNQNVETFNNRNTRNNIKNIKNNKLSLVPGLYVSACDQLGIGYDIIDERTSKVIIRDGGKKLFIAQLYNTFNDSSKIKLAKDKYKTSVLLSQHHLPVPKAQLFTDLNHHNIYDIANKITIPYPLVIKQLSGANGDHVYVNIMDKDQAIKTLWTLASDARPNVVVEQFIPGKDYRVLVFNHQIIDIIYRPKPMVKGDGHHTLKQLVDLKNKQNQAQGLHKLIIDHDYLKIHRIKLDQVIQKNTNQVVNPLTNFHQGSYPQRVNPDRVHPDNLKLFREVSKIMGLTYCGIDFLSPNISKSYRDSNNKSGINEVNGLPNLDIHYYADMQKNNDVVIKILKLYFKS